MTGSGRGAALAALVVLVAAVPAEARQGIWPERGENLQVLPESFGPDRLRAVMLGFSGALGVRCSYCHDGVEGEPLTTYDFASDANPNKDRARAMYRLLGTITGELRDFPASGAERVNMWCHTCHAGRPRPQTLDEAVLEAHAAGGAEAAVARYLELRERYFAGPAYDFRPPSVDGLTGALHAEGDTTAARRFAEIVTEENPDWWPGWERRGDLARERGAPAAAREFYQRALTLAPGNARLEEKLADLGSGRR